MRKMALIFTLILLFSTQVYAQDFTVETAETKMLEEINALRVKNSLSPLKMNWEAARIAKYKCEEMKKLNYTDHLSPVYGSPAEMLTRYGVPFEIVGENIYAGARGGEIEEWLAAPVYKENILYGGYIEAGVGCCVDDAAGNSYWVLLFIS